jgi:hypothetical protein
MVIPPVFDEPHGGKKGPFHGHMCNPGVRRGRLASSTSGSEDRKDTYRERLVCAVSGRAVYASAEPGAVERWSGDQRRSGRSGT